jgi:hypothetical protein
MASTDNKASGSLGLDPNADMGRSKSEYSMANLPYGLLNRNILDDNGITGASEKVKAGDGFFKQLKVAKQIALTSRPDIGKTYYAIVLKVLPQDSPGTAQQRSLEALGVGAAPSTFEPTDVDPTYKHPSTKNESLVRIKARIPELHANIPIPSTYPRNYIENESNFKSSDSLSPSAFSPSGREAVEMYDNISILLYPTFVAVGKDTPVPQPGSIVMVEMSSTETGIYIGPAKSKDIPKTFTENIYSNSSLPFEYSKNIDEGTSAQPAMGNTLSDAYDDALLEIGGMVIGYGWDKTKEQLAKKALGGDFGSQVAKYVSLNTPYLQKQGANFYSSNGGLLLKPRSTLAGITQKVVDEKGRVVHKDSKILNRGIYKVATQIKYLKDVKIKPTEYDAYNYNGPLYALTTNRVRVYSYGDLGNFAENLVPVSSVLGARTQKLHILAAERIKELNYGWIDFLKTSPISSQPKYNEIFKVSHGWHPNQYNDNYKLYVEEISDKYGSLEEGMKFQPFHTSYETGLVFKFGNNGFADKSVNFIQNAAWQWLVNNAYLYGIYPTGRLYNEWEVKVPRENWFTATEFVDYNSGSKINGKYYKYCSYVIEESVKTGKNTSDEAYDDIIFE